MRASPDFSDFDLYNALARTADHPRDRPAALEMAPMLKSSLQKLDRFLSDPDHGDDVMLLSELDGFLAGVAVCPDLILPSEWLEVIWGEDGPVFASERQASEVLGLIMGHYNDILRRLTTPGRYAPLLEEDRDGRLLWELWAAGFAKAIGLRPEGWADLTLSGGPPVHRAMAFFRKLDELANQPGDQFTETDKALDAAAPELIPECLEALHLARLALLSPDLPREAPAKSVGRNDPCPCGSGKKFKKCCLQ